MTTFRHQPGIEGPIIQASIADASTPEMAATSAKGCVRQWLRGLSFKDAVYWRIGRGLIWISVLAGVAALAWRLEDTPPDPTPRGRSAEAPEGRWVTLVFLQRGAGDALLEFRPPSRPKARLSFREDAPGIVAYYDEAHRANECRGFLNALQLAADRKLQESVWFEEDSAYPVCVAPVGQIRPAALPESVPRFNLTRVDLHRVPGALWERAPKYPGAYLQTLSRRTSLACPAIRP